MRTAWLIARKDLRLRLRDKSAFIYGIIAPLALAFIFSMVLNPVTNAKFTATYDVLDYDRGPISQAFSRVLDGLKSNEGFTIRSVSNLEEAKTQVERGSDPFAAKDKPKADAAFMLPPLLSQHVLAGEGGNMTVYAATGSDLAVPIALSVASGFAAEMAAVEVAVRTAMPPGGEHDPAATDDDDALTDGGGLWKNMRTQDHRMRAGKTLDEFSNLNDLFGIEPDGRFV